ncbi:MAG: hypothetical protein ACLGIR_08420 [Actinomycetes bacterium]
MEGRSTTNRRLVLPLALALGVLLASAEPPTTSTEGPQQLAGTSELTVTGSGTAVVDVPQPLLLSLAAADNPNLSLQTDAEAATAVLRGPAGATLLWSRVDPEILCVESSPASCADLLSQLYVLHAGLENPSNGERVRGVPAGRYELHVVSTDPTARTTVRITTDELAGAVSLSASSAPSHEFRVLDDMSPTLGAAVVTAGATGEITDDGGTLFRFVAATGSLTAATEIGDCVYDGTPTIASSLAYAPPCPAGESTGIRFLGAGNVFTFALAGMSVGVPAGTWSHGGYVAGPTLADDGVVVTLWLG